jgi:hypothetical protein
MHFKNFVFYLIWISMPAMILIILSLTDNLGESSTIIWFFYACYGLFMTTYFFVKGVNWELGGCVITNQRLLRFGYKGLIQATEREILPRSIEDLKVVKKGLLSFIFNTAYIYIYTTNREVDVLRDVIEPQKIRQAYAEMVRLYGGAHRNETTAPGENNPHTPQHQTQQYDHQPPQEPRL